MTESLAEKTCTPCRGGVPPLPRDEALRFQAQAPDWELRDDARRIERTFRFRNFREALAFVQQVGELAESEGHHPDISFGWGHATVSLSTKKIKGLIGMGGSLAAPPLPHHRTYGSVYGGSRS
jgi:4a-hydroxytetrahydrobiopterin dehydratase